MLLGRYNYADVLMWAAEAYATLGQPGKDWIALPRLRGRSRRPRSDATRPSCYRLRGDLLHAAGDPSAAERNYHQAIAVAERQSAKLFQLRASTSLARLLSDQGKRAEARDLLGPIYNWFTEGFDAPDLKDAKALLEQLTS